MTTQTRKESLGKLIQNTYDNRMYNYQLKSVGTTFKGFYTYTITIKGTDAQISGTIRTNAEYTRVIGNVYNGLEQQAKIVSDSLVGLFEQFEAITSTI